MCKKRNYNEANKTERQGEIMNKTYNNIRVIAENKDYKPGFIIYIDFSGQREYLMDHRENRLLFKELKGGMNLGELKRWKTSRSYRKSAIKLERMMSHLNRVVDSYLAERAA